MLSKSVLFAILAASSIVALPLNINLGAYSPAIVVGDGEISFGGETDAAALINTLAGADADETDAAATGTATQTSDGSVVVPTIPASSSASPSAGAEAAAKSVQGLGIREEEEEEENLNTREADGLFVKKIVEKHRRDLAGFTAALNYAAGALKTGPEIQLGTEEAGVGIIVEPQGDSSSGMENKTIIGKRD